MASVFVWSITSYSGAPTDVCRWTKGDVSSFPSLTVASDYELAPWTGLFTEMAAGDDGVSGCVLDMTGKIWHSSNLGDPIGSVVWTMVKDTLGTGPGQQKITFVPGSGYAVGGQTNVFWSADGVTWSQRSKTGSLQGPGFAYLINGILWLFGAGYDGYSKYDVSSPANPWVNVADPGTLSHIEVIYSADLDEFLFLSNSATPRAKILDRVTEVFSSALTDGGPEVIGGSTPRGSHWSGFLQKWIAPVISTNFVMHADDAGFNVYNKKLVGGANTGYSTMQSSASGADAVMMVGNNGMLSTPDGANDCVVKAPPAGYLGYGIMGLVAAIPPQTISANFVGPSAKLDAVIDNPYAVFGAFTGPHGYLDALLVNAVDDPIVVEVQRLGNDVVYIGGDWAGVQNVPATHRAIIAKLTGPSGYLSAALQQVTEISADFVGPSGRLDALLGRGQFGWGEFVGPKGYLSAELLVSPMINANFVGPSGQLSATLVQASQLEASFVGPHGFLSSYYPGFVGPSGFLGSYYPGLVGPSGRLSGIILNADAAYVAFVGPHGSLNAELLVAPVVEAGFVGPSGYLEAEIENNYLSLTAAFVGPSGYMQAELANPLVNADFIGPAGYLEAELDNPLAVFADFVGPRGRLNATLIRGLGIDAFFRGPHGHLDAELGKVSGNALNLLLIQP